MEKDMELVSTGYLLSCLRLSMKLIVMSVEQRLKLFLFFVWKSTSSYPDLEHSVPWWFLWCIRVNFNIIWTVYRKKAPNTCEIWWQYCILKRLFCIFVIFSKHNVECTDHQCNFWRKRDVSGYNWWGFLKVFLYLPILFCRNILL